MQGRLRNLLAPRVYTLPLVRAIGKTMLQGKNYGPQITVKRLSTRYLHIINILFFKFCFPYQFFKKILHILFKINLHIFFTIKYCRIFTCNNWLFVFTNFRGKKCKPIFSQIARQVVQLKAEELRLPARAWKVKLIGEGADDAGGVFDDTITEMCQELKTGTVPLLIHTPNARNEVGYNRDRYRLHFS